MEIEKLGIYGVIGFVMAILSGISGAGAGFVTTPLAIFLGLSPAHAVATGKLSGLGIAIGSLSGMSSSSEKVSRRRILPVMLLALVVGLAAPFVIKSFDSDAYQISLGIVMLALIPFVVYKKVGLRRFKPKAWQRIGGGLLLTLTLSLQGVFSSGMGTLVNFVLMGSFGMTAIEANITKRWSQLVLNGAIVIGLIGSGLIIWQVAAVGMGSTLAGSFIGGRMAAKKGNRFIMQVTAVLMFVTGVALLATA